MSFEREAMPAPSTGLQPAPPQTMKEERVLSPYGGKPDRIQQAMSKIGQQSINESRAEAPASPEESVTLSPQMAALARKEQKFRQQEQSFKEEKAKIESERAEIAELKALKARLEQKDFSDIEKFVPYDEYTNHLIEKSSQLSPEQQALKALETKFDAAEKARNDEISSRFEAAVSQRRIAVNELVDSNPEFKQIKKANFQEHVVQYILDTWEHDQVDLSPEQAAKDVLLVLKEKATKWSELLQEESPEGAPEGMKQLPPLKTSLKTITNNMTATGDLKRPLKSFQGMSDGERWTEARRRAEEKLNKGIR